MSTKILGNEELNILRAKTPYSLPDNPSDKGFNARQIKTKFWEGYLLLFNWLKETQASLNNDFATTNSALLNESKRIDVILTYFSNGKANFAVRDRNNNIIDETYELKSEASTKFNQLIADIQSVSSASGNKIAGSQNINADGIQYTITLSNTQNATLSTITQYLPLATTLKAGLLSSSDKEKLNNIESDLTNFLANAKAYTDEKLQRDNIVNILGAASHTLIGLLTAEDKKKIDALYALLGEQEDADTVVNTINEVLAIFSSYPEGVDIVSQLEKKVNYTDVINTLDSEETSKPLSAKMGKELKTKVDTKAELAYVNEELNKKALKSDILIIEEAVTTQESEITTTQSEGDKLVDEIVGYVDGSPRGVYASLSALQSAFPSGAQGVYVCSDNGHWYYWSGTTWTDGGVYQSSEDINEIKKDLPEIFKTGAFALNNNTVSYLSSSIELDCGKFECDSGDVFSIVGVGGSQARRYIFVDINNNVLSSDVENASGKKFIFAPQNARYLYVSFFKSSIHYLNKIYSSNLINKTNVIVDNAYSLKSIGVQVGSTSYSLINREGINAQIFYVKGASFINVQLYKSSINLGLVFVDENGTFIESATGTQTRNELIKVPSNAVYCLYSRVETLSSSFIHNIVINKGDKVITLSASNSSEEDKLSSDFICDGVNDCYALSHISKMLIENGGGKIILKYGRYLLNDIIDTSYGNNFLLFYVKNKSLVIESEIPNRVGVTGNGQTEYTGAQLYVTEALYNSLSSSNSYSAIRVKADDFGSFELHNIGLILPNNQKKIIGINFSQFKGTVRVKGFTANAYNENSGVGIGTPPSKAVEGCVGLITQYTVMTGPNGNDYENIVLKGFYEGFAINSEHNYLRQCASVFCVYGYTFNHYSKDGRHPNVLIKCIDERGVNLPYFYHKNVKQANIFIGYSTERYASATPGGILGDYAKEEIVGDILGEITYTSNDASITEQFWEDGHGHNCKTTNMAHSFICDSATRLSYKPNFGEMIFDTTLNKQLICINETNSTWADMNGNIVN